jgi:carboxymethylenebutenolidase
MRAGEDPGNTVPGNKTAREQGFARLVKLLKEMKSAPVASSGKPSSTQAGNSAAQAVSCHGGNAADMAADM